MFPTLYLPYAAFTVWALLRAHRSASQAGRLRAWRITAAAMVLLPVLFAMLALLLLVSTEQGPAVIVGFFSVGGIMLVAGLLWHQTTPSSGPRFLRLGGWSLIAGITLVPSWLLVLLLPVVGLLAFLVPGDFGVNDGRRQTALDPNPV
jgi:hypothetical protein